MVMQVTSGSCLSGTQYMAQTTALAKVTNKVRTFCSGAAFTA